MRANEKPGQTPNEPTWKQRYAAQIEAGKAQRKQELENLRLGNREYQEYKDQRHAQTVTSPWTPTYGTAADYQTARTPEEPGDYDDDAF